MTIEKTLSMFVALSVTLGVLNIAAPAAAQNKNVVVTAPSQDLLIRRVSYRDLDLATLGGEKILVSRVGYAVKDLCLESVGPADFYAEFGCRGDVWSGARPQIKQAVQRARELSQFGFSAIPPVAISISFARH